MTDEGGSHDLRETQIGRIWELVFIPFEIRVFPYAYVLKKFPSEQEVRNYVTMIREKKVTETITSIHGQVCDILQIQGQLTIDMVEA